MIPNLKHGATKLIVRTNILTLARHGYSRHDSIRYAFNAARASFFKSTPNGTLPPWLAYPADKRTYSFYLPNGAAIRTIEHNPVRQLDIDDDEREAIKNSVQKQLTGQGAAIRKAAALYTEFTGHENIELMKVDAPVTPTAALAVGQVDAILYTTIRDNVTEKYIHKFKKSSRPLLVAAPDGSQLYLIGGSYNFTDRGIVDK